MSAEKIARGVLACMLAMTVHAQSLAPEQPQPHGGASLPALLGKPAPSFAVMTLDGRQVSLADYRGKALILNFWATWCGACRLEMPWLSQLREQYANQDFEVLGIVTDDATDGKVRQLAVQHGVKYPLLWCNHKTAQAYGGLSALPQSFFINRNGRIVGEMSGADSKQEIETMIRKTLQLGAK